MKRLGSLQARNCAGGRGGAECVLGHSLRSSVGQGEAGSLRSADLLKTTEECSRARI